jgi:cell wall assembly regulator SMI1
MDFPSYLDALRAQYAELDATLAVHPPATPQALELAERTLGFPLGSGLREAWTVCDGSDDGQTVFARPGYLTGFAFLSIESALAAREDMRGRSGRYAGYRQPEPRSAQIRDGWFHEGWLPFASFGGGTLLLMQDFDPAPAGVAGQVIAFTHDPDSIDYVAPDFAAFLIESLQTIEEMPEEFIPEL